MADDQENFEALNAFWQQSQKVFLTAHEEASKSFLSFMESFTSTENAASHNNPFLTWMNLFQIPEGADDQFRTFLQTIADGPRFADHPMPGRDMAEATREIFDYQKATQDMAYVMQAAWGRAHERYSQEYFLEDMQSGNTDEALKAWLDAANHELLETQRSDEFLDAQKRMIRASTEIKARQADAMEAWSNFYQMPTRTEVDDLAKTVHDLKRELRATKRELEKLKAERS